MALTAAERQRKRSEKLKHRDCTSSIKQIMQDTVRPFVNESRNG